MVTLGVVLALAAAVATSNTLVRANSSPDLVVGAPLVDDANPSTQSHFTLSVTVTNAGDGESEATTLRYYWSTDSTITSSDTQVGGAYGIVALEAAGAYDWSVGLTAPSEGGTYYYGACVDSVAGESDTTNNCLSSVAITVINHLTTGAPTISGTAQVGQTLTADVSGIADADGLTNVSYSYRWLSSRDSEIDGATNSTYTVQASDNGKVIKVQVTFTDYAGNDETLTSDGTSAEVMGGL